MYTKLHRPQKNEAGISFNANSCVKLVDYLSKEIAEGKTFFSHTDNNVLLTEVINKIDNNKKTLKNKQDKFYMLSYNPSEKEIAHLIKRVTGKEVKELGELTEDERIKVFEEFRDYVRDCMDIYASNFNREKSLYGKDLVYFGKIEEFRHYSKDDEEVKLGLKKRGDLKEGLQLHVHVIVSRMDKTQTIALSPLAKSTGNSNMLNGKEVKNGFSMKDWQYECFEHFGNKYMYIASAEERFYHKAAGYEKIKRKIKNKVINEIMDEMKEEKKLLANVRMVKNIIHPSNRSIKMFLARKIKNILFDNEPVI